MATKIIDSKTNLVAPSVHSNGSGFKNLEDQYREALDALDAAQKALPVPHGRDYYTQKEGAYEAARDQRIAQSDKLREVSRELRAIFREILNRNAGVA